MFYNNYTACRYIDNKNFYDLLFHDIECPSTVLRKINGVLMDSKYRPIDVDAAFSLLSGLENGVIVKPSVLSVGGHGIKVLKKGTSKEELVAVLAKQPNCVIQELISQHEKMSSLHKESVNTIRIVTWVRANGKVEVLNSIVRMGVGGSFVDNASSGGIFCGIKEDGWLSDVAYNTSGKRFERHPQGAEFGKVQVPNYDQCIDLVLELAPRMLSTSRLVSWDIAINDAGKPLLIEANLAYGELDFHQITKGPLFGEYTPEMIEEVFSHKRNVYLSKLL